MLCDKPTERPAKDEWFGDLECVTQPVNVGCPREQVPFRGRSMVAASVPTLIGHNNLGDVAEWGQIVSQRGGILAGSAVQP